MEYYDPDEVIPSTSPLHVPVHPILESDPSDWTTDEETGEREIDDIISSEGPVNRILRDRKRHHGWSDRIGPIPPEKKHRVEGNWTYGVLEQEIYSRRGRGWTRAAGMALVTPPSEGYGKINKSLRQLANEVPQVFSTTYETPITAQGRQRKRFTLPLFIAPPVGEFSKVIACPDSGSDENIMSLELMSSLGLKIEQRSSNNPRQFSVANGNIVTAVGQVSTRCSFSSGAAPVTSDMECIFHVFNTLAVPLIMGFDFLQKTETLSKHRNRLVEQIVPAMQTLRVKSVGKPKRSLVCRLNNYVACATVDTGSDLDLASPAFAKPRAFLIEPASEQVEFADCSIGYISGVIKVPLVVGKVDSLGFHSRGEAINIDLFVLENLNADVLVGQDTINALDVFNQHNESLIPSIPRVGQSDINIIRHIGSLERSVANLYQKVKSVVGGNLSITSNQGPGFEAHVDIDQRENARRERERARISTLTGPAKKLAMSHEDAVIRTFESTRRWCLSLHDLPGHNCPSRPE